MSLRTRTAVALTVAAVALAGCGPSSSGTGASGADASGGTSHHLARHATGKAGHGKAARTNGNRATHGHRSGAASGGPQSSGPASTTAPTTRATFAGERGGRRASHPRAGSRSSTTGPAPVVPGTYTFTQSGSQHIGGFTQQADPTATLVVRKAKPNGRQTSQLTTASGQPPSDQTLLFNNKGMFLVSQVERVKIPGKSETIRCTFHPAVPYPPWPVAVGAKVSAHTDCGQVTVRAKGAVIGRRTASIGGTSFTVYVIKVTLTTSGQVRSTSTDTEWFSPQLRLAVRDVSAINGKYGPFAFSGTITRTLTSTTPR